MRVSHVTTRQPVTDEPRYTRLGALVVAALALTAGAYGASAAEDHDPFKLIFGGRTLEAWESPDRTV